LRVLLVRAAVLRDAELREEDFREEDFRAAFFDARVDARLRGTFSPFSRASLIPIAIACSRLVTLRPLLDLSVPCLRRRIALSTVELALLLYFRLDDLRVDLRPVVLRVDVLAPDRDDLRAAI
jgi:hypothetical protein